MSAIRTAKHGKTREKEEKNVLCETTRWGIEIGIVKHIIKDVLCYFLLGRSMDNLVYRIRALPLSAIISLPYEW